MSPDRRFPQHYAAASLKHLYTHGRQLWVVSFPQHYAAASLKLFVPVSAGRAPYWFSAALRCGLIEAYFLKCFYWPEWLFSAALRCGLIEASRPELNDASRDGFPQHYAAASLKP